LRILLIEARGLGDAVISTKIVESLGAKYGKGSVDVWPRRECREIFVANLFVPNIYLAVLPIRIPGRSYVKAIFRGIALPAGLKACWRVAT
jgi:ADP-heptose:LPS heptosyltransferase